MSINPAALSKINWTNGIAFVVALAAVFGVAIPADYQALALQFLAVVTPVVTVILRTFFTGKAE